VINLNTKIVAAALVAACTFTGSASAQVNMQEADAAIAEFNMQDLSADLQDKESQGYAFIVQNAIDSNNALKDELKLQITQAQTIGDVELVKTLQAYYYSLTEPYIISAYNSDIFATYYDDAEIFSQMQEELNDITQNNMQTQSE
jgi:hypothetical protein